MAILMRHVICSEVGMVVMFEPGKVLAAYIHNWRTHIL